MDAFSVKLLACLCAWLPLSTCGPIYNWEGASEDEGRYLPEDDYQENEAVDFNSLLEHMKGQFLKSLNLPGNRPPPQATAAGAEPPEYMVDLYNKFANDKTSMPSANIVRSFRNEDMTPVPNQTSRIRRHSLLFNVSIPRHEEITMAELRLYTLVDANRRIYEGVDRKVTVYESAEGEGDGGARKVGPEQGKLAWRQAHGANSGWETFDVTQAILRWSRSEESTHRLLVQIESTEGEGHQPRSPGEGVGVGLDSQHVPLLIVYSDDRNSVRKEAIEELEEIISHEKDVAFKGLDFGSLGLFPDEGSLLQRRSNMLYDTSSRTRRNAKRNYCKRSPLYVEFKEIGWDSWIIAPTGYEAYECKGLCYYPLTNEVTPTQHAIVQTLVNHHNPKVAAKACCVPTKLDPISILYLDEAGVVTYKFKYEGMMVAECGCR